MNIEQKINELELKKATLFSNIEMLSTVNDSLFAQFGKTCVELMKLKRQQVRETENIIQD
jgi:hypothetical protein